jgi:hypothetical protein
VVPVHSIGVWSVGGWEQDMSPEAPPIYEAKEHDPVVPAAVVVPVLENLSLSLQPHGISLVGIELDGSLTERHEVDVPASQNDQGCSHSNTHKEDSHDQRVLPPRGSRDLPCQ